MRTENVVSKSRTYVAVCNKARFDGHYFRVFVMPIGEENTVHRAMWYYLNVLNVTASIDGVVTLENFRDVTPEAACQGQAPSARTPAQQADFDAHGDLAWDLRCATTSLHSPGRSLRVASHIERHLRQKYQGSLRYDNEDVLLYTAVYKVRYEFWLNLWESNKS